MGTGNGWALGCVSGLVLLLAAACADKGQVPSADDGAVGAGGTSSGGSASSNGGSASSSGGSASANGGSSSLNGGSSSLNGGSATSDSGGSQNSGPAGAAGEAGSGAGGEGGDAAGGSSAGGSGGQLSDPLCVPETAAPKDDCAYPESLGGGESASKCGVTEGAWYPLGYSESVTWPKRTVAVEDGIMSGAYPQLLMNDDGSAFLHTDCEIQHWDGNTWQPLTLPEWAEWRRDCIGAVDRVGRFLLAFKLEVVREDYLEEQLHVIRQTDADWEDLGILNPSTNQDGGNSLNFGFGFDASNQPLVFYRVSLDGGISPHFRRWNGVEWTSLSGGTGWDFEWGDAYEQLPRILVTPDGRPVVAVASAASTSGYTALQIRVVEWTGDAWNLVASAAGYEHWPFDDDAARDSFRFTFDASGAPVVSWRDGDALRLLMQSEGAWNVVPATEAVLETLPEVVRWHVRGTDDVRVSRLEDCRWTGLSASHFGGGVSNSEAPSSASSLAFSADRVCAAWTESWGDISVFVRCHDR